MRGAKDVALEIGEGEDLLAAGVPAEVDLWEMPENTGNKTDNTGRMRTWSFLPRPMGPRCSCATMNGSRSWKG